MAYRQGKVKRCFGVSPPSGCPQRCSPENLDKSPIIRENRRDRGKCDYQEMLTGIFNSWSPINGHQVVTA
jgi:hypothetical protein